VSTCVTKWKTPNVSTVVSIDSTFTREFPNSRLHELCRYRAIARYVFSLIIVTRTDGGVSPRPYPRFTGRDCRSVSRLSSPVGKRRADSPGFTGLRRLDRVNPQLVSDVPQLLNGLRFRLVIIRHVLSACVRVATPLERSDGVFDGPPQKCNERAHATRNKYVCRFSRERENTRECPRTPEHGRARLKSMTHTKT